MSDEEDFREFAASRQKQLLRSAYLLRGDWHGAEDLVQTADALGISEGTVKSQSSRALALLRTRIGDSLSDIRRD